MTVRHFTASAVVLDDRDRVLLIHHNKAALWLYPGGHVEPNESPAEAAIREVAEETGIQAAVLGEPAFTHPAIVGHLSPWAVIEGDAADAVDGPHRHIDLIYVCRAVGGTLVARVEEVSEARWVPIIEVAELATPTELPDLIAAAVCWRTPRC